MTRLGGRDADSAGAGRTEPHSRVPFAGLLQKLSQARACDTIPGAGRSGGQNVAGALRYLRGIRGPAILMPGRMGKL
jgi:hypothetical protein